MKEDFFYYQKTHCCRTQNELRDFKENFGIETPKQRPAAARCGQPKNDLLGCRK